MKTYLTSMVINACRDNLRKKKRREHLMHEWAQGVQPCNQYSPEDNSLHSLVRKTLYQLPLHFRIPLQLCEWEEMKYEEIAMTLNIPINTVRSRIARGRVKLSELLVAAGVNR